MPELIYKTTSILTPETFTLEHSTLKIKSVDNPITLIFLGTFYMELPRIFNNLEIWELEPEEVNQLLLKKPSLQSKSMNFWKLISNNENYYIAALSFEVK